MIALDTTAVAALRGPAQISPLSGGGRPERG